VLAVFFASSADELLRSSMTFHEIIARAHTLLVMSFMYASRGCVSFVLLHILGAQGEYDIDDRLVPLASRCSGLWKMQVVQCFRKGVNEEFITG
jgi:hypothetical protein